MIEVRCGDALEVLRGLPAESVQCCVTSPPYWGLRDYGVAGQIGLERTPQEYVARMVEVFREVRRVLREDGTLWLNLGDSYHGSGKASGRCWYDGNIPNMSQKQATNHGSLVEKMDVPVGCKPKDIVGIPWRVAFALQADGWWLRQDIIWAKPNPMPESVRDRCTKAHEYIFMLSKSARYYFDAAAIKEPSTTNDPRRPYTSAGAKSLDGRAEWKSGEKRDGEDFSTRNRRSVWTVTTKPFKGAHFATFPPDLIEPCVLAGTKPGDVVLDPFGGSGTTGMVALELGRKALLIELNPKYIELINKRTFVTPGLALA